MNAYLLYLSNLRFLKPPSLPTSPYRFLLLPVSLNQSPVPFISHCLLLDPLLLQTVQLLTPLFSRFPLLLSGILHLLQLTRLVPYLRSGSFRNRCHSFTERALVFLGDCLARREKKFVALDERYFARQERIIFLEQTSEIGTGDSFALSIINATPQRLVSCAK